MPFVRAIFKIFLKNFLRGRKPYFRNGRAGNSIRRFAILWSMDYYTYGDLVVSVGEGEMSDVTLFGFDRSIELERELTGATRGLKTLAALSGQKDGTVMAGFSSAGAPMSVAVCHKGKLYDISDCGSGSVKVFKLRAYRIGLLVDEDALDVDYWLKLRGWCDFAVCVVGLIDETTGERIAALSHSAGVKAIATDGKNTVSTL